MAQKGKYSGGKRKDSSGTLVIGLAAVMGMLVLFSLGLRLIIGGAGSSQPQTEVITPTASQTESLPQAPTEQPKKQSLWSRLFGSDTSEKAEDVRPAVTEPEKQGIVAQASIAVTGDILMHLPVTNTGLRSDGTYNYDSIFQYLTPYSGSADYSVANLETTLAGSDMGYKYSGHPAFNTPDAIVDSLKAAGFDMLLTANNHCYDTSEYGFLRTVRTIKSKGLTPLGTREQAADPIYTVQDINGIKIGMVCYTYEGQPENPIPGTVYMNRNALSANCAPLVNAFVAANPDPFYQQVQQVYRQMKQDGAEATVIFIHWGDEYQTSPNAAQQTIAQQLCDIGFDVIVGGHPHVIQPVQLLSSRTAPEHKTMCVYSTGNAVSNQRIAEMNLKTGHTEDGMLLRFTFSKYADGGVYLEDANILPCWVDMRTANGKQYVIIPLDASRQGQWQTDFALTDEAYADAVKSYDRTEALVGAGIAQVQQYFTAQKQQREGASLSPAA